MDLSLIAKMTKMIGTGCGVDYKSHVDSEFINFLSSIDQNLDNFSELHVRGLAVECEKAAKFGCSLKPYPRVEEVPIVKVEKDLRWILKKERPQPVRKDEPVYEDILLAMGLFDREVILSDIASAKEVASRKGKNFHLLTTLDYACDYYPIGFMEDRSQYKGDSTEYNIKEVISKIPKRDDTETLVTIWAEGSKAFSRYHRKMGFTNIIVVYPSDFPSYRHDTYVGYFNEKFPSVPVTRIDACSSKELSLMNSDDFVNMYDLPRNAFFLINFLPQFMNLRFSFKGFACIYSDEEVISESKIGLLPNVPGDAPYRLDYFQKWILRNHSDCIKMGHGGIYDPIKRIRLSYSQHGCFEDHIRNASDFGGNDFVIHKISTLMSWDTNTKLKIVYGLQDFDSNILLNSFENRNNVIDDLVFEFDNYVVSSQAKYDMSSIHTLDDGMVYIPMLHYSEILVDLLGRINVLGVLHNGFPPNRIVRVSICGESFFVLDILYARKTYIDRRSLIPYQYRVPYSTTVSWNSVYVVYLDSSKPVGEYGLDFYSLLNRVNGSFKKTFPQYIHYGYGWNPKIKKIVLDDTRYLYGSFFDFDKGGKDTTRFYEFDVQYSIRKALRFKTEDVYWELGASKSSNLLSPFEVDKMLGSCPSQYKSSLVMVFLQYYAGYDYYGPPVPRVLQDIVLDDSPNNSISFASNMLFSRYVADPTFKLIDVEQFTVIDWTIGHFLFMTPATGDLAFHYSQIQARVNSTFAIYEMSSSHDASSDTDENVICVVPSIFYFLS